MATTPVVANPPRCPKERAAAVARRRAHEPWAETAATLLSDLGFRLLSAAGRGSDVWRLLVALRDQPTERHFDPERVAYYAPVEFGAELVSIDRTMPVPDGPGDPRRVLWGHVHVVDRIPVENRFLTFGGDLRISAMDPGLTVLELSSPAPIVRWGGHSQGTDLLAAAIGAFFGRLIVPVDFVAGAAARIDAVAPAILYRAFLADGLRRAAAAEHRGADRTPLGAWIVEAWRRAREDTESCDAAQRLLRDLELP